VSFSSGSSGTSAKTLASGSVLPSGSCATNSSNPGTGTSAASVLELLIERVPCRRSGRISYSTTDDHGDQLGVLDPIEDPSRGYLGVYHSPYGLPAGSTAAGFRVSLARSYDLIHWHRIAILDPAGATEPVLFALPRTRGYLLAYEKNDSASNHLVRIRYYSALKHLLVGRFAAQLDLPRRYVIHNNGTPDIESVAWHGSLARSVINLTFHYEAGPGRAAEAPIARPSGPCTGFAAGDHIRTGALTNSWTVTGSAPATATCTSSASPTTVGAFMKLRPGSTTSPPGVSCCTTIPRAGCAPSR